MNSKLLFGLVPFVILIFTLNTVYAEETLAETISLDNEATTLYDESTGIKIIEYGMFDAEDDGNLVNQLFVGETYWFNIEYQYELETEHDIRIFMQMIDKNKDADNVLRHIDGHGIEKPFTGTGHGFEWVPEYTGQFKTTVELTAFDDSLINVVLPEYDFEVITRSVTIESPLKQMKHGITLDEIVCKASLVKMYKLSSSGHHNNAVCVKSSSVEQLLQRGYSVAVHAPSPLSKSLDDFTISETLKETIREKVDNGTHESLFVGIIDWDGTEQYYYGHTAKDENPIDENTIFEIGSVSKVLTSLILADMVVHDEISLDDPIDKFLPENVKTPSFNGEKISLLDLATHTSGLPVMPNYPPNPDLDKKYEYNQDGIYEYLADFVIHREIGSQYEYSNTGGSLLGHLLSLHEGKSYEQTLKERVLDKLGMDSTCVNQCDKLQDWSAKPHSLGEQVDGVNLPDELAGAGAIRSSGKDMLTFLSYAMDFEDSELQSAFELTQTANHKINEIQSIGLGWQIIDNGERNIIFHNGATKGFASYVGFDSDANQGVVVLTNSQVLVDEIGLEILEFSAEE